MNTDPVARHAPRVTLRKPIDAQFEGSPVLVLDLGLGGAMFEHRQRVDVARRGTLACGPLVAQALVRHSTILPMKRGMLYHTGVSFIQLDQAQCEQLFSLLIEEAQEQTGEWEANLGGHPWTPSIIHRSAVAHRFIGLHLTNEGWHRKTSSDPNQPLDGITIVDDTPKEEIRMLCDTYRNGDEAMREMLRKTAMLSILERLRQ